MAVFHVIVWLLIVLFCLYCQKTAMPKWSSCSWMKSNQQWVNSSPNYIYWKMQKMYFNRCVEVYRWQFSCLFMNHISIYIILCYIAQFNFFSCIHNISCVFRLLHGFMLLLTMPKGCVYVWHKTSFTRCITCSTSQP